MLIDTCTGDISRFLAALTSSLPGNPLLQQKGNEDKSTGILSQRGQNLFKRCHYIPQPWQHVAVFSESCYWLPTGEAEGSVPPSWFPNPTGVFGCLWLKPDHISSFWEISMMASLNLCYINWNVKYESPNCLRWFSLEPDILVFIFKDNCHRATQSHLEYVHFWRWLNVLLTSAMVSLLDSVHHCYFIDMSLRGICGFFGFLTFRQTVLYRKGFN